MYHQVYHSAILRATNTVHLFVLCGSKDTQQLLTFTELTNWLLGAFPEFC